MATFTKTLLRNFVHHRDDDHIKLGVHTREMIQHNWFLGFTCFGGPAVHFQIASIVYELTGHILIDNSVPSTVCR